jgi:multidrug efflux pump
VSFTDRFIQRPVLALVVNAVLLLIGLLALQLLPIRQYPLLENATISINTQYPGAPAALMQGFVTQPIAQSLASVEGIDYLSSSSVQGTSHIDVRLRLGQDSSQALTEVMAKVNQVRYRLPEEAYDPVIERSSGDSTAVAYVGFASQTLSAAALSDYLAREVEPVFSAIEGVAKVETFGGQRLAMRLWLDPARLAARNLTAQDVAAAIRAQNYQAAPGQLKGHYWQASIEVNSDLRSVEQFRDLVIHSDEQGLVRLRDIGSVELAAAASDTSALMDGEPAVHLGLFAAPLGNPLEIVAAIKQQLEHIRQTLPPGVKVELAFETARFIQASIDEVLSTLIEAMLIVVLVIYLCLGSLRTVLIPIVAIPLSLLGAAGLMLAFGFSINLLTLLAMVLAIGLVVDDAIVVVENTHRHMAEGKSAVTAALLGAREVAGPVISMTLTLTAVYAPIAFLGGLTAALFREFALSLAGAVVISGIVALTLSPVMASLILRPGEHGRVARLANRGFDTIARRYATLLQQSLGHRWISLLVALLVLASLPWLYQSAQHELAPVEDQANLLTSIKAPQYANLNYSEAFSHKLDEVYQQLPETSSRWIINGTDGPATSFGGVNLSLWDQRERDAAAIQADLQGRVDSVEGSNIFAFQLPALPGSTGGMPVQLVLRSAQDYRSLYQSMQQLKQQARDSGLFAVVDSDLDYNNSVQRLLIDRDKANAIGVDMAEIAESLALLVGENYVNRFALHGRSYDVIPQANAANRLDAQALAQQYVRSRSGQLVPLAALVQLERSTEPNKLTQFNQQNSATLQAIPAPGVSLGQCVAFLEQASAKLAAGFSHDWQADARQYVHEGNSLVIAFVLAVVIIYLVLAAQYESLIDPLIILITVPLSLCGALIPLALGLATVNIYTQIGLVTLIGLISKHGILMVAFANEIQVKEQLDRHQAIIQAAQIRLRPILMTTAAMVVGLVPLLFASGAGAHSRQGLGLVIVCGMLLGTLFTLLVLPTLYSYLARDHRAMQSSQRLKDIH